MALWGLPVEVVGGMASGMSASFFTLFELDSDSTLAKALFGSRLNAVILSSVGSFMVGVFVGPLAGLTFEMFFYPACYYKNRVIERKLRATFEEARKTHKPGESIEIEVNGAWHKAKMPPDSPRSTMKFEKKPFIHINEEKIHEYTSENG